MKAIVKIEGGKALPANQDTEARMIGSEGRSYAWEWKECRSPGYHRYAMKMMRIMWQMAGEPMPFDQWRKMMTIKAGYYTAIGKVRVDRDGSEEISSAVVADSLAFENMGEDEFKTCFGDFHQAFVDKYGQRLTDEQLESWSRM